MWLSTAGNRLRDADPRIYQIGFLLVFLAVVLGYGTFHLSWAAMGLVFLVALATQKGFVLALELDDPGPFSPLISSLSMCLLLRTDDARWAMLAAFVAIASKFVLRLKGKHVFNPTNLGIVAVVLFSGGAWISPGQWGSGVLLTFLLDGLGLLVVRKVGRLDITLAYLGAHAGLNLARVLWLGERPEVFAHRMLSGALIIFAFFMISDPRSTPDARSGRVLFASLVAAVAYVLRFHYFIPAAPIWALAIVSPLTPVIDAVWRGRRFEWADALAKPRQGDSHVQTLSAASR